MKRTFSILAVIAVLVVLSSPSYAEARLDKLKDGVKAMVTSPLEVKDHAMAEAKDGSFLPITLPAGILKGSFYMAKKMVSGALDVVTFPIIK